ncbi:MAG: response regulator [Oscillospiraceae bacterium]|nr:response regulator [Oscillospiraceae bacterium]
MKTLFVVDDNDVNLVYAEETLSGRYNVFTLPSAAAMFTLLENVTPDLILLDIEMPEMDGFEALKKLKSAGRHADIPVVFVTGWSDDSIEALGFEMGAVDFVIKPFSAPVLLNRIQTHLDIEGLIRERTARLQRLQGGMVSVLSDMVESRDKETGGHIERTTAYIRILLNAMLRGGVYAGEISGWNLEMAVSSARLHDIGKVAISDLILNKPGKLTAEEFEIMKTHAAEGGRIIERMIDQTGDEEFLHFARLFAVYHHERWDGTGYPRGLKGEEIPLQGRIMAIVDVYDALVSDRPYKQAFTHEKSVEIIRESRGKHFDPNITDVFLDVDSLFAEVSLCQ